MNQINLAELTNSGQVRNLAGHERGIEARQRFKLDELDGNGDVVTVVVPEEVYLLSPSFIQGMFSQSMQSLGGRDGFFHHYGFDASPLILEQIESGIDASMMEREPLLKK